MTIHNRLFYSSRISFLTPVFLVLSHLPNLLFANQGKLLDNWRQKFVECVRIEALSPNTMVRNMTIFSVSVHDALNTLQPRYATFQAHDLPKRNALPPRSVIAGCGWEIAQALHPNRLGIFKNLANFALTQDTNQSTRMGFLHGRSVAQNILDIRRNDGATTSISYLSTDAPGQWRRTPNFFRPPEQPHWRKVTLWALPKDHSFLPPAPPSFDSNAYISAVSEVKVMGGSTSQLRTKEESFIAKFWKDFSYTQTPPGHWNEIASFIARSLDLDLWEEARLFALLNLAMSDAGIVAWQAKYKYHLWRPVDAIRHADQISSTQKLANDSWSPYLETPPHPEYPSAHSCFSGAASQVLEFCTGSDAFSFRVSSDGFPGKHRKFESFSECTNEIGKSRLYGGIHFNFSNTKGIECGKKIGTFVYTNLLKSLQTN